MGNATGLFSGAENQDEEDEEAQELDRWRPSSEHQQYAALKRKRLSSRSSESTDEGSGEGSSAGDQSSASSHDESVEGSVEEDKASVADDASQESGSKADDNQSSAGSSEHDKEADVLAKQRDAKRKKKMVVRMDFEPLLSLHEPLAAIVEEPVDLFTQGKQKSRQRKAEQLALENAHSVNRRLAKETAEWLVDLGLEDCVLRELAAALGEEMDELKYALTQSGRFTVDDEGTVTRTMLQKVIDCMDSDIETLREIVDKLSGIGDEEKIEDLIRETVRNSLGELRLQRADDVELVELVDLEAQARELKMEGKGDRGQDKRKGWKPNAGEDDDSGSSSGEDDTAMNKEAERRALAFRRIQVQRKIEEFLKTYAKGQNLTKINAKGKRYHRRVYIDTAKKSLVIQGATGPKLFPFASMKEVDIETRTTKEGRVETMVICAIEKGNRIVKELNLSFPDQAKANTFVNCVTLFSQALRSGGKRG